MSVVVAIKKDNVIYMGADSQATRGGSRSSLSNPNNYKIWKVKDVDHCLIGHVGRVRDACVIRVMSGLIKEIDVIKDNVNFDYVVNRVHPCILDELKKRNYVTIGDKFEGMESRFLLAFKDKLFSIGNDGSIIEVDDFIAIGSGEAEAIGSLLTTSANDEPSERIIKAIKSSAVHDIYVDYPIIMCNTETTSFEVIDQESIKNS